MAKMIPANVPDFHGSLGEERVFRALRALPDDITVIHSLRWLHPGNARFLIRHLAAQGEGDFVLVDPAQGIMVVEVKGGDVWCEDGEWRQRNRKTSQVVTICPETQASNTMHRIRAEIAAKIPEAGKVLFCHAVWFPDGAVDRSCMPMNYHRDMTLDAEDLVQPTESLKRAFQFWRSQFPKHSGPAGPLAKRILQVLAPTLAIVQSVRQGVDEREEAFIQLTREQARVLDFLDEQLHAAVIGAAGTGKTLLAIEKARRLATPTEPVLFLCFNAALRDHLAGHHAQPNVHFQTFHGFVREIVGPSGSLDDAVRSFLEQLADDGTLPYENLVVDEGQDFDREWLEFLRLRFRDGAFYVFYDRYQAIQGEKDTQWLSEFPCRLVLTRNCRNTDPIARSAYRAAGLPISPTLGLKGPMPSLYHVADTAAAVARAASLVEAACIQHKTPPHEIAIVSLEKLDDGSPWLLDRIGGKCASHKPLANHVTVTTVRKFKGLEAALVIVVGADFALATSDEWRRLLYVACSRARHAVHIITTTQESALGDAVCALAGTEKVRPSFRSLARQLGARIGGPSDDPFNEPGNG